MASPSIISQKLLRRFIAQKKLTGTVSFLRFLKTRSHLKSFYAFCELCGCRLQLPKQLPSDVLFHGSKKLQYILVPNISMGKYGKAKRSAFLYATDDPNYAIFLALLNLENGGASVVATEKESKLAVDLDFVNGPSKIKHGYVHVLSSQSFTKTK